jgi:type I restriction enzyme S subunit
MITWTKQPLKRVATINAEVLGENTDPDFELQYLDIGNVDSRGNVNETNTYRFEAAPSRARRIVRHGDVIISTVRTYLQAIASIKSPPDNLIVSTGFAVVRPDPEKLEPGYCKYALRDPKFLHAVVTNSVGVSYPAITALDLANISIYTPPLNMQRAIADYLDRETAKIDALIRAKQRLLELLAEKRQALITQAVTRGLDNNVPLHDSGIEWLGTIPAHWQVVKIKALAQVGNGSTPLRDNDAYWQGGTFPWLTSTVVNQDIVGKPTEFVTDRALRECHLPIVHPNSILVAITGEGKTRGMAALLTYQATINQHLAFITPHSRLLQPEFAQLFLSGVYNILRIISEGTGSTKGALTCEQLGNFVVVLPPLVEQQAIVSAVTQTKAQLDRLATVTTRSVELMQERRAALIAAAVNGQIAITG